MRIKNTEKLEGKRIPKKNYNMAAQGSTVPSSTSKIRNAADFHPDLWKTYFLTCPSHQEIDNTTKEQHKELKEEVKRMIMATTAASQKDVLQLIDIVQRLGVAYHFEKEIEAALNEVFHDLEQNYHNDRDDLYTVSLRFRLLRQQGILISCDIFTKFKEEDGKFFKESLTRDVKGMLSLYEAAYLSIHGEEILDEAITFTTTHLKSMALDRVCPNLVQQINHALYRPLRKALPRLEARYFIDIYARDDLHNQTLLDFAKLDFNILQAVHQKELSDITRWWAGLQFSTKLQYTRDRIVELYFWIVGVYFEPEYVLGRKMLIKVISMASVIDDTFDAHGTFEELQLFKEAVNRWDRDATDILPEYMKIIYRTLLDIYKEIEEELAKQRKSLWVNYAKGKMQELVSMYFEEAKWLNDDYFPTVEEYNSVALLSAGLPMLSANSFLGMGDFATDDAFKWVVTNPKSVKASAVIGRFLNDIVGHESERKRRHIASAVECYMNQFAVSKEEAVKVLYQEVANAWKDINEEFLIINNKNNPTAVPFPLLERILNLARTCDFIYKDADHYTNSYLMKDHVALLLKDPIIM